MDFEKLLIYLIFSIKFCNGQFLAEQKIVSYKDCSTDRDCSENSFCFGNDDNLKGRCKCLAGYELLVRNSTYYECDKLAGINEPCTRDEQCMLTLGQQAFCQGTCRCQADSHFDLEDRKCYKTILLNDFCKTDKNCLLRNGEYAACTAGRCTCDRGRPAFDGISCIDAKNLGDNCQNDEECALIGNSICREVCVCQIDFVTSRNQLYCLKAATNFGDNCIEDAQCSQFLKGSRCLGDHCGCSTEEHEYAHACYKTAKRGDLCESVNECIFSPELEKNVNCTEGICHCLFGNEDNKFGCRVKSSGTFYVINKFIISLSILVIVLIKF